MVTSTRLTVEEFETLPLEGRWELIDGEPVEMSPAADESASTSATILGLLWSFVRPRRLGRLYNAEGGSSSFRIARRCVPRMSPSS